MYLVSACLAGVNCRYDGRNSLDIKIEELVKQGKAIAICPELLGGLKIPRECCEMVFKKDGSPQIMSKDGNDFTNEFLIGAHKTLEIINTIGIKKAILKSNSPSCGMDWVYDGTFSGNLIRGNGITAGLLLKNGIEVYTEKNFENILED